MAIKIIKEGKVTKFTKTCPDCGCEFEYEASDLQTDYSICLTTYPCQYNTYIVCPCCGKHIYHGTRFADEWPNSFPKVWYTSTPNLTLENNLYDCEKCPNRPDPNKIIVGDTPCTWCRKNQPYCTSYGLDGKAEYNVDYKTDPNTVSTATYTYTTSTTSFVEDKSEKAEEK